MLPLAVSLGTVRSCAAGAPGAADVELAVAVAALTLLACRHGGMNEVEVSAARTARTGQVLVRADDTVQDLTQVVRTVLDLAEGDVPAAVTAADWTVRFTKTSATIVAHLAGPADMIDDASLHYPCMVETMAAGPHRLIRDIPTLTPDELVQRARWNDTEVSLRNDVRLEELFLRRVRDVPHRTAVFAADRDLSYTELDQASLAIAQGLVCRGVRPGDRVALLMARGWEQVAGVLGVLRAGGVYVPLEIDWPLTRLRDLVRRCGCQVVLTQTAVRDRAEGIGALEVLPVPDLDALVAESTGVSLPEGLSADEVAYIIFTSGSTGSPKGVVIEHCAAANTILDINRRFAVNTDDRVLAVSALGFDLSVYDIFGLLAAGGSVVLPGPGEVRDPGRWQELVRAKGVTLWNSVPALLDLVVGHPADDGDRLATLRLALLSGDWIPVSLPDRLRAVVPAATVVGLGGATEGSIWSIAFEIGKVDPAWNSIPYGQPLTNQRFHVLDQHLQPVPVGVVGQLHIGGTGVARGYWDDPDRTAEAFHIHPATGERLYRTGDYGVHRADGVIEFRGRRDHQVKVRGFRVELGEIESALRTHPEVRNAVAVLRGRDDPARGDIGTLLAYVEPVTDAVVDPAAETARLASWDEVFQTLYTPEPAEDAGPEEFRGWVDIRTDRPIPMAEMRDWADRTAALAFEQDPGRVLDVGCGDGALVSRIAPACRAYHGVDSSLAAIRRLRARGFPDSVRFTVGHAHDLSTVDTGAVDTVLLNSVVQYFPSVEYLLGVLDECQRVLAPGGRVLIADVRSLPLLRALYAEAEFRRADAATTAESVLARIANRENRDPELAVHPRFFVELGARLKRLGEVDTRMKSGDDDNELTRYRYDVVLRFDTEVLQHVPERHWQAFADAPDPVFTELSSPVTLTGVPDPRLEQSARLLAALEAADPRTAIRELPLTGQPTTALDRLRTLAARAGLRVYPRPGSEPASIDVTLAASRTGMAPQQGDRDLRGLANRPLVREEHLALARRVREHLLDRVPDYLVPASVVVVPRLPLTPNGKIDRAALPEPGNATVDALTGPSDSRQRVVAEVWSEVLGTTVANVEDNFLDCGGDSLSALRVVAELARRGYTLAVEQFFRAPTVAEQAALMVDTAEVEVVDEAPEVVAMTPVQQGMVLRYLAEPHRGLYLVQARYAVDGAVNEDRLRDGIRRVFTTHELLQSGVAWSDSGEARFSVRAGSRLSIETIDLCDWSPRDQRVRVERLLIEDRRTGFDVERGPLLRCTLVRMGHDRRELVITFHHAILDGWSLTLLEDAIAEQYEHPHTAARRRPMMAPATAVESAVVVDLPTLLTDPTACTGADLDEVAVALSVESVAELHELCRRHRLTLSTVVQGAWAVLLSQHTNRDEVLFGVAVDERPVHLPKAGEALGCFIATRTALTEVDPDMTVVPWLRGLQDSGFLRSVVTADGDGASVRGELFDTVVITEVGQSACSITLSNGQSFRRLSVRGRTEWPVAVLIDAGEQAAVNIQFDPARLTVDRACELAGHLRELLHVIAARPDDTVATLPMFAPGNGPSTAHGVALTVPDRTIDEMIAEQARATPDAVAVIAGDSARTYRDLLDDAERVAAALRARGAGPNSIIGVCATRGPGLVALLVGVLRAGAGYLPLDPRYPAHRLRFMIEHAGTTLVLGDNAGLAALPDLPAVTVVDLGALADESADDGGAPRDLDDTAYLIYTSGSTGRPKGVQVTHRAVANLMASMAREPGVGQADRVAAITTISFDIAVVELFLPLTVGATVVVVDEATARNGGALAELLDRRAITLAQATPTTWRMVVDSGWTGNTNLRVICGGEPLSADLAAELLRRSASVWNVYGPSETTVWSTAHHVRDDRAPVPIGRPIANTTVHILDTHLRSVHYGAMGEIFLGGAGLAAGYWRDPTETSRRFLRHPGTGERLYRTGDLGTLHSDGLLRHGGRTDAQVKIRGFRIEPGEIEATLTAHPAVASAAVGVRGGETPLLVGYVVLRDGSSTAQQLRDHVADHLPAHMVPARIVVLDGLPVTPNGKIDRAALPDPGAERPDLSSPYRTPRAGNERVLADVWSAVLGVDRIGVDDNYFALGGDSLGILRIVALALKRRLRLTPRQVVAAPTIGALAEVAEPIGPPPSAPRPSLAPGPRRGPGYTPADFPLSGLTRTELDDVLTALGQSKEPPHA